MLKTLSAMLDNFDTQMADYMTDIDMQVHAFSLEPWLHDEAKMEEDAPGLKLENYAHPKQDGQDQGDLTIEIDMEEHNSAEYDMVDDEQLHQPPEILDVEVYDASLAHSPAMGSFDSVLPAEPSFSTVVVPATEPQETDVTTAPESTLSEELIPTSVASPALPISEEPVAAPVPDSHQDVSHTDDTPNTVFSSHESVTHPIEPIESASFEEPALHFDPEYASSAGGTGAEPVEERSQEEVLERPSLPDLQTQSVEGLHSTPDEGPPSEADALETTHASGPNVKSISSVDPHEISEGVYIDPPPAVLLTLSSDDHEYEVSLFNEPAEWQPSTNHHADAHRTLLHHLPTMYYESLYSLFEALRQDESIQSTFHLPEVELVLQAVDLGLTISEDNVYSREVSLHDLNMLHDGSGIGGPLRTKLYASNPRFIIQYQQLQEHVSRLSLGHQSRGVSFGGPTETHDNQPPHLGHISDHQEVASEAAESETHLTKPSEHGEPHSEDSEESAETETHLPSQQSFQPGQSIDLHEEPEPEDKNRVSLTVEKEESRDSRTDEEESPTDSFSTAVDNDHDNQSTYAEDDNAVIGLDTLEAEVTDQHRDEEEHGEEASAPVYDGSREDDEFGNEPLEDSFYDPQQDDGSQIIDGREEVDRADEQGDEISHEYSEYAEPEPESEALPDQFQLNPQDADEHDQSDDTKEIDHPALRDKADGQEYEEEEPLPELPTDPISFDEDNWELKEFDESWNDGDENERSLSNHSSVTLSSRGSKRTYDEYESGGEEYEEEQQWELPESPDSKRSRTR